MEGDDGVRRSTTDDKEGENDDSKYSIPPPMIEPPMGGSYTYQERASEAKDLWGGVSGMCCAEYGGCRVGCGGVEGVKRDAHLDSECEGGEGADGDGEVDEGLQVGVCG